MGSTPEWVEEGNWKPRLRGIEGKLIGGGGFCGDQSWGRLKRRSFTVMVEMEKKN